MAEPSLKRKTGIALFWSFIDKGGQQVIQLVFVFILARLVSKDEFGAVAVLAIFTIIANMLQESGFSAALIRKKDVSQHEYSSVFYFNISISFAIYILFFFCAPLISWFFEKPILTDLSRFIFLAFVFNAFGIIQNVNLIKAMDFKANTRITLIAGCLSGLIAVGMAYKGFGIWSLAAQQVIQSFLRTLFLWIFVKWRPLAKFTFIHIKEMSGFSLRLLLTNLMNQICANIVPILIGKKFSLEQVAAYGQGAKFNSIPQSVISDGIKSVAFPLLSNIGHDEERGKKVFRKIIRITAFISFPMAVLLFVLAHPIIDIYLPPQWSDVVPILQFLSIGGAFYPLYSLISSLLQYKGRSGLLFKIELIRNILQIIAIFITVRFGVLGLVTGVSAVNATMFFIGIYIAGRTISYSIKEVIMDIMPYLVIAIFSILPFIFLSQAGINNIYLLLVVPLIVGSCLYLLIVKLLGSVVIQDTLDFLKQSTKRN